MTFPTEVPRTGRTGTSRDGWSIRTARAWGKEGKNQGKCDDESQNRYFGLDDPAPPHVRVATLQLVTASLVPPRSPVRWRRSSIPHPRRAILRSSARIGMSVSTSYLQTVPRSAWPRGHRTRHHTHSRPTQRCHRTAVCPAGDSPARTVHVPYPRRATRAERWYARVRRSEYHTSSEEGESSTFSLMRFRSSSHRLLSDRYPFRYRRSLPWSPLVCSRFSHICAAFISMPFLSLETAPRSTCIRHDDLRRARCVAVVPSECRARTDARSATCPAVA